VSYINWIYAICYYISWGRTARSMKNCEIRKWKWENLKWCHLRFWLFKQHQQKGHVKIYLINNGSNFFWIDFIHPLFTYTCVILWKCWNKGWKEVFFKFFSLFMPTSKSLLLCEIVNLLCIKSDSHQIMRVVSLSSCLLFKNNAMKDF
jgi:hypothetical protein